jgi:predicted nucleotidyltransferase
VKKPVFLYNEAMSESILKPSDAKWSEYRYYLDQIEREKKDLLKKKFQDYLLMTKMIASMLYKKFSVQKVFLIGSLLDFEWFHDRSDIDIVVEGLDPKQYFKAWLEIENITDGEPFHLIDVNDISEEFYSKVITKGRLL